MGRRNMRWNEKHGKVSKIKKRAGRNQKRPILKDQPFVRCLAELNRSNWFCRPVPNLPAQAPLWIANIAIIFGFARRITKKIYSTYRRSPLRYSPSG